MEIAIINTYIYIRINESKCTYTIPSIMRTNILHTPNIMTTKASNLIHNVKNPNSATVPQQYTFNIITNYKYNN